MANAKSEWDEVGKRLEALALKLKLHAKEELSEDGATVKTALEKLGEAVQDTAKAVGDAVRDPGVRDDAREAVRALADALTKTFDRRPPENPPT